MIGLGQLIFGTIVVLGVTGLVYDVVVSVRVWAARRRRGRRSAWERRQRAARGGMYMDPKEFRRQFGVRLHELEESDAGQTFIALAEYGRRSSGRRVVTAECTNVSHNAISCRYVGLALELWCDPCREDLFQRGVEFCERCGCTEDDACGTGCWWVRNAAGPLLCSACVA